MKSELCSFADHVFSFEVEFVEILSIKMSRMSVPLPTHTRVRANAEPFQRSCETKTQVDSFNCVCHGTSPSHDATPLLNHVNVLDPGPRTAGVGTCCATQELPFCARIRGLTSDTLA